MDPHRGFPIEDATHPGEVRRQAAVLAAELGFAEADAGRVALVVTEAATNVLKHAGGGHVLLRALRPSAHVAGVEIIALDKGRGMSHVARCMQDGYSTAGSPGTGLGAIARLASSLELYTAEGHGTALLARVFPAASEEAPRTSGLEFGVVRVAAPGESACGDDWSWLSLDGRFRILLADGLGHGPLAAAAAEEAARTFQALGERSLQDVLRGVHEALRATRGAAVSIAEVDPVAGEVRFLGLGNVQGFVAWPGSVRNMVTQNGTAGVHAATPRVLRYPWKAGATLVLYTDGLTSRTSVDSYPGLLARSPTLVASVLYRDFVRGRDDATVVVARDTREGA
jgi:anti-sigma regulatory factor (Ser/Thr protein kinase)